MALLGRKRHRDEDDDDDEGVIPPVRTTRARHKKMCREHARDMLSQHFEEVQTRAMATLDMVQATDQHRLEAERLLEHYRKLLTRCYAYSIARSRRDWVAFKPSDFDNPDDVILLCHGMPLTQSQELLFKKQVRRLNSDLTALVEEMNSALVLTGFVAQLPTVQEIRCALREYKKLLTGALLDFYEDIAMSNDDSSPTDRDGSEDTRGEVSSDESI